MRLLILITAAALSASACSRGATDAAAPNASGAVATAGRPDAAPAPKAVRELTIPAGTLLPVILDTSVGSATSHVEESVHAHVTKSIVVDGIAVVPNGSRVSGVVTDATPSGRIKGRAHVGMRFETLAPAGAEERYTIHTTAVERTAAATKEKDALEIGAPAAGGALIGALVGGKKGALIGGGVGAGAGTGVVLSTRGKEVSMAKGSALTLKLTEPVTVHVDQ